MRCLTCQKSNTDSICGTCDDAYFCSEACYKKLWSLHKLCCSGYVPKIDGKDDQKLDWPWKPHYLKDYMVESKLGEGQYGDVWLFKNVKTSKHFAIKLIKHFNSLQNDVSRLLKLSAHGDEDGCSEFVTCYYDHARTEDPRKRGKVAHIIVMSYVEGSTFNDVYIKTEDKTPALKALLKSALEGLRYIHSKDIIHSDIKPANLLIHEDTYDVVYADFGFACEGVCDARGGTPEYMAPEIFTEKQLPNKMTDIFSLGVVFFKVALGETRRRRKKALTQIFFDIVGEHEDGIPWIDKVAGKIVAFPDRHVKAMDELRMYLNANNEPYAEVIFDLLDWEPLERPTANSALQKLEPLL